MVNTIKPEMVHVYAYVVMVTTTTTNLLSGRQSNSTPHFFICSILSHKSIGFGDISQRHAQEVEAIQDGDTTILELHDLEAILDCFWGSSLQAYPLQDEVGIIA